MIEPIKALSLLKDWMTPVELSRLYNKTFGEKINWQRFRNMLDKAVIYGLVKYKDGKYKGGYYE
jgi:hypothetical protein